ncbi:4-coumarate-CoA ligase [Eremomyces bilateralis CBS 781.70]|uniref:4-coumarate-CoA ligase n=1 Tax=Eremomyces bilateralis CBS 781.70 TaxID=1392243 RepID=A0A6G1GBI3_9PEZI|nr:4-coumarate-CoA ligase [Eremomyces bilateralis CBS 781.70]KAF1815261.1 4-coumarate-CoA ligase [Eremomyces bilateralis CBS 781.70]
MPVKSKWSIDIPQVSLPTYLFGSPDGPLPTTPTLISTVKPDTVYLSLHTYRQWSKRLAAGLQAAGFQPGDRLLLFSGNTLFFPVVIQGAIMAGGIFTGANPTYVARELAYQLRDSGAKFLISAEGSLDTALEAAKEVGLDQSHIFAFDDGFATFEGRGKGVGNIKNWTSLLASEAEGERFKWEEATTKEQLDRTIALNYSSGTTGVPKGVMITHTNYIANTAQMAHLGRLTADSEEKEKRTRLLCFLPMYHAMAQTIFGVGAAKRGIPVYLMPKFDFLDMLACVQKFRITDLTLVPPVVVAMSKHPATKQFDLSSVERVGSGAAPLGRDVCSELEKLWPAGKINVKQGWGMTEATCSILGWHPDEISESFSVGEPNANCAVKIVDENGKEVAQGERGELWCTAPNIMKGYWNKPEATKETLTPDGWLKTGDIAYMDKDGKFFIVDRMKELIKVKGLQVAPAELEALLLEHPDVADAAVIGVTVNGEEYPRAYIIPQVGSKPTEQDIHKFMEPRVSRAKRLVGGVRFVDEIPKNPSGKILRKLLREQAKAEGEAPAAKL